MSDTNRYRCIEVSGDADGQRLSTGARSEERVGTAGVRRSKEVTVSYGALLGQPPL